MFFNLGLLSLFFLPVIESFSRETGLIFLFIGSLFLIIDVFRDKKIQFDIVETVWLILLVIFSFSILHSLSIIRSFTETLRYFAYFIIFISVRYSEKKVEWTDFLFSFVLINGIILTGLAFLTSFSAFYALIPKNTMNLYFSNFGHNRLSDMLVFSIPLTVGLLIKSSGKMARLFYWGILILFTLSLFLSLGRGAIFSLALAIFLILFIYGKNKKIISYLSPSMKLIFKLALVFGVMAIFYLGTNFIYSNFLQKNPPYKNFSKPAMFELRLEYWRQAGVGFLQSPLLGTGLDTFVYISKKNQLQPATWSGYTHNHFLEIFTETGIIGGTIFVFFMILLIHKAFSNLSFNFENEENILKLTVFIALTASVFHTLVDYNWQYLSVFMIFFICCSLLIPKPVKYTVNLTRGNKNLLIIIFMAMGFIRFGLFIGSDLAIANSEILIDERKYDSALSVLYKAYLFDPNYNEIHKEFAWIYELKNEPENIHYWNQKAIDADRQDSYSLLKK